MHALRVFPSFTRRALILPAAAIGLSGLLLTAGAASAGSTPEQTCQDTAANAGLKYFADALKALSACESGRADGSIPELTNCRPSVGAVGDADTVTALSTARTKLDTLITKKCGTANVAAMTFGKPCESVANAAALVACIADDAHGLNAENLVETIFDSMGAVASAGGRSCQIAAASAGGKLAQTRAKTRRKCAKSVNVGKTEGPCPDAKGEVKLDKAVAKFADSVKKSCSDVAAGDLTLGFPCDLYEVSTFDRKANNGNKISLSSRLERCLAAASAGAGDLGSETASPLPEAGPFSFGVAAGDETDVAFIAWTRTTNAVDPVTLEVATDDAFATIVSTQALAADAAADNTVHGEVTGLTASTQYYYRFTQAGSASRVGRVKTAPVASSTAPFTFAFTGDANAYFRPFAPLEQITKVNPDVWLFIGDTIYGDDDRSGSGVASVRSDYHNKYRENRADRASRDTMAAIGMYTIWDDHEVTNDFWGTDPAIQTQMTAGSQGFRDYMPIRVDGGDPMRLYRSFKWGNVAEFFLVDARQYRSAQADVTETACVNGKCSVSEADCVEQPDCDASGLGQTCHKGTCSVTGDICSVQLDCDVIQLGQTCDQNQGMTSPNATCQAEIDNPARTYLGAAQLAWLESGLQNSTATFKFVMNGPLISALGFVPYDRWEGYSVERQGFLDFITTNSIKNVIFLSTDIHAAIINDDVDGSGVKELVSGAIGMDPIVRELPADLTGLVGSLPLIFPTVSYFDLDRFNVATATVSQTELEMTWVDNSGQVLKTLTVAAE